jgi:hypothetical protein
MHGRTGNWHENGDRSNLKGGKRADMNWFHMTRPASARILSVDRRAVLRDGGPRR